MKAFLFPHGLLAEQEHYIAALHGNEDIARGALKRWFDKFDPERVLYAEHKLIGIAVDRFPDAFSRHEHRGVFANVSRQARLRAHVASAELGRLLARNDMAEISVLAIGETYERFELAEHHDGQMETLELAVGNDQLDLLAYAFMDAGFAANGPARRTLGRGARTLVLISTSSRLQIRLLGLAVLPEFAVCAAGIARLHTMTPDAHRDFMRSRRAGLLRRQDQVLFDLYRMRARGTDISGFMGARITHKFWRQTERVLGHV